MSQAIAAGIGLIVGALVTGGVQYMLQRREDSLNSRAAARLLRDALLLSIMPRRMTLTKRPRSMTSNTPSTNGASSAARSPGL